MTAPESAPPCGACGHEESAHVGDDPHGQVCTECDGAGGHDIMLHPYEPSAPRPTPETAARCAKFYPEYGMSCGFPPDAAYHDLALRGSHAYEPPAPPAEPVEAGHDVQIKAAKWWVVCRQHSFQRWAGSLEEARGYMRQHLAAEPVEEQRCSECGLELPDHTYACTTAPVGQYDERGFLRPSRVGAEDEGARPLSEAEARDALQLQVNRMMGAYKQGALLSVNAEAVIFESTLDAYRAAIRKEATAALDWKLEDAKQGLDHYIAQWIHERTRAEAAEQELAGWHEGHDMHCPAVARAEAAEGALREIVGIAQDGAHFYTRDHWLHQVIAQAERALTAESVTPGAEG